MAHVATLTIDRTKVDADLIDFPVLVIANGDAGWAELYAIATEGGGDIRVFKSDDTTEVPREIVAFSVSAETGEIHFKYSGTLSSTVDTDIHIYADGVSSDYAVSATYGRNAVWTGYKAVHHGNGVVDSSGNLADLTNNGSTPYSTGKVGKAFDGGAANTTKRMVITGSSPVTGAEINTAITFSSWIYAYASKDGSIEWINQLTGSGTVRTVRMRLDNASTPFTLLAQYSGVFPSKTNAIAAGNWYHVVLKKTGTTISLAVDNVPATVSYSDSTGGTVAYHVLSHEGAGNTSFFSGMTDEVRVSIGSISADFSTTEYNNQNSPSTFYAVEAVSGVIEQALTATAQASGLIVKQVQRDIEVTAQATTSFIRSVGRTLQATAQAVASVGKTLGKGLAVTAGATVTLLKTQVNLIVLSVTAQANASLTKLAINTVTLAVTASATVSVHILKTLTRILTATAQGTVSLVQSGLIISRELLVVARANVSITLAQTLSKALTATASAVVSLAKDFGFLDKYPENEATYEDKYPEQ